MINGLIYDLWLARDTNGNLKIFAHKPEIVTKRKMVWTGEYDNDNPYGNEYKVYKPIGKEYQVMQDSYNGDKGIKVDDKYFKEFVRELEITDSPIKISLNKS